MFFVLTAPQIIKSLLACLIVLICGEITLRITNDFNLVYPYTEFFTNKFSRTSIHRGDLWGSKEYCNIIIRDADFQHSRAVPDLSQQQKIIYLIGDSMVESVSTPLDESFHGIVDKQHNEFYIVTQHYAGCSLDAISIMLNSYPSKFIQNGKVYKPDIVVAQLRGLSYQGGNTNFFDQIQGKNVDYQPKLNDREESSVVKFKQAILNKIKFDVKFSSKFKDKFLRELVLGNSHILSLLAWRFYNWSISQTVPNNESFTAYNIENDYWTRFENSLQQFINVANQNQIQAKILLIPDKKWFNRYTYVKQYNSTEKHYIDLFEKYQIPYVYSMEDIYNESLITDQPMFWNDGHPSIYGSKAIAKSLERLIK